MSMYHNPTLVRMLMEERIREARRSNLIHCCDTPVERRGLLNRNPFRRQSPATCSC